MEQEQRVGAGVGVRVFVVEDGAVGGGEPFRVHEAPFLGAVTSPRCLEYPRARSLVSCRVFE